MSEDKIRENRLRRMARRQDLQIVKSRRRDPMAATYGGYMIVDPYCNAILAGSEINGFNLDIDEVEAYLKGE